MKKQLLPLLLPVALIMSACTSSAGSADSKADSAAGSDTAVEAADTATVFANIPFEVKKFRKEKGENELEVEYPVNGNPELINSVRTWLNEQLTATYKGPLDDADAFFRHYAAQLGEDPDLAEYGGYTKDEFEVEFINDYIVTYDYTSYIYEGGAHGMGGSYGTTFLQSDGRMFSKKCFTSYKALHELFVEGLKEYFKVKTDAELMGCLLNVSSLAALQPPGQEPWIEEDGIVFSYTPYEIAPYSSGSPRFIVPLEKISKYLNTEGKLFFGL